MSVNKKARPGDVQSVHRALQLLESVGNAGEMGVSELAQELGLAVSTVHNILRTLVHRGYLNNSAGRYRLGPAVTVLASQWDPVQSLATSARASLMEVSKRTGQAAVATVLIGAEARPIAFTSGTGAVTASSPGWTRENPMGLATGRVLVAMSREPDWPEFVKLGRSVEPKRSAPDWRAELTAIAGSGVCVKQGMNTEETVSVAVPVWTTGGSVICSIGCSTPGYYANEALIQDVLDALWDATVILSQEFGCEDLPLSKPPRAPRLAIRKH